MANTSCFHLAALASAGVGTSIAMNTTAQLRFIRRRWRTNDARSVGRHALEGGPRGPGRVPRRRVQHRKVSGQPGPSSPSSQLNSARESSCMPRPPRRSPQIGRLRGGTESGRMSIQTVDTPLDSDSRAPMCFGSEIMPSFQRVFNYQMPEMEHAYRIGYSGMKMKRYEKTRHGGVVPTKHFMADTDQFPCTISCVFAICRRGTSPLPAFRSGGAVGRISALVCWCAMGGSVDGGGTAYA